MTKKERMFFTMLLSLIWTLICGAFVGWLAGIIMNQPGSTIRNIIVGIIGSIVGTFLFDLIGFHAVGGLASLIVSVVGACVLLMVVNWLARR
jgi:uncharacterized membrane protein YeaQ/YmgE (transglycosylase-associated protein family)